ncbi:FERM domain-containing protein [Sergentomyia squamirostris]
MLKVENGNGSKVTSKREDACHTVLHELFSHITRTAGWLPPAESWGADEELPYGWEKALDEKGRPYYINHCNKTTTYEAPDYYRCDEPPPPPEPRLVILQRSPTMGFGFVAGSEKPVIVRFVTEGGPSVNKLEPGDQILAVNGEDVKDAPRDRVIQLVRSCESQVNLLVTQPPVNGATGRKSTLLSAGKKAKLRTRPSRVRFAESVCVNGAPLFPPSAFSLGDLCVPPMANVLKVFLENGQTKSFKYDATTTVQDVVTSLRDKLCLSAGEHFSLVLEHVKSLKRNKLTLLDPQETLVRIAARPGAHKLRCLFRVTFVPVSAAALAQRDLNSLDYLFMQCCNDVTQERFAPELQPDVALRLAALHMHQHALANNISPAKLTVKTVEREFGLERFVPTSLIEGMKRKELRRLISHFLKLNTQMTGSSKMLTQLQAKLHYLDIISGLPSYGAKCFSTNQRDGVERVLLVSPRFGLSQIAGVRNSVPQPICNLEELIRVIVTREDEISYSVVVFMEPDRLVTFLMEDRDAIEFALVLAGYYRLAAGKELNLEMEREIVIEDIAPPYLSQHSVMPTSWSYLPTSPGRTYSMAFSMPPPYHSTKIISAALKVGEHPNNCDRNMNSTLSNNNHKTPQLGEDEFGFDLHSVMAMEILEDTGKTNGYHGLVEARNEEVMRRVVEMQRMVETSERYLSEQGELLNDQESNSSLRLPWRQTSLELDSDCDSMNSSKLSSNEDSAPAPLKHSDSLILLAECISQDLTGITNDLNSICGSPFSEVNGKQQQGTPKVQRRMQGLSQLLSDLQALGTDYSQSESDSESLYSPNSSPIHRQPTAQNGKSNKTIRTSFGLHSPDNSVLGDNKDNNLKEYLRQLREASNSEQSNGADTDLAAKKLSELYGFELCDDTLIETDPDLIDLTAIPPPQTPDELDALTVIDAAPMGFGDPTAAAKFAKSPAREEDDLERFLAKMIIAPPTQKVTPAKELTPEEILSFIIPPPPGLEDTVDGKETEPPVPSNEIRENGTKCNGSIPSAMPRSFPIENLYSNSCAYTKPIQQNVQQQNHVIEYSTVDRKGPFSCCTKSKKEEPLKIAVEKHAKDHPIVSPPPRMCPHNTAFVIPERPPKSAELQLKLNSPVRSIPQSPKLNGGGSNSSSTSSYYEMEPPNLPPRFEENHHTPPALTTLPPKKPPLPPVKPTNIRSPVPILKNTTPCNSEKSSPVRVAGINSPHFHRHPNTYKDIDRAFNTSSSTDSSPTSSGRGSTNGHNRSNSDCPPTRPQLSLLNSPLLTRKTSLSSNPSPSGSPQLSSKNGHVMSVETLLAKTDVAMAGLLVKLDQIAAMCSAAQAAGGGISIDEDKFQNARDELTDQALALVTASKLLVVALSDPSLASLPEHLTSCLTALRRITELAQDMTRHTSSPLQTRNIVLKVHDVASSFRELAGVKIGVLGAGQLALQAECLANMLATLLRSLRVFSP